MAALRSSRSFVAMLVLSLYKASDDDCAESLAVLDIQLVAAAGGRRHRRRPTRLRLLGYCAVGRDLDLCGGLDERQQLLVQPG